MAKKPAALHEFRSADGSGNNLADSTMNAAGDAFDRVGPAHFVDGISVPILDDFPNPRDISNIVVGQGESPNNPQGFSGYIYAWGQFIDHDLDLMKGGHVDLSVHGPDGTVVPVNRVEPAAGTGPGTGTPSTATNDISGWLDASMVYGSDAATANSLRAQDGSGHLLTSDGDNLPIVNGVFLAGDQRADENPSLTALQTLFVREHNFQVDRLHAADPDLDGDTLYETARAIVTAEIANITYGEFLPHLLGDLAPGAWQGYDPTVDPRMAIEFAGAAYRFGHSTVSPRTEKLDESGEAHGESDQRDAFFLAPDI